LTLTYQPHDKLGDASAEVSPSTHEGVRGTNDLVHKHAGSPELTHDEGRSAEPDEETNHRQGRGAVDEPGERARDGREAEDHPHGDASAVLVAEPNVPATLQMLDVQISCFDMSRVSLTSGNSGAIANQMKKAMKKAMKKQNHEQWKARMRGRLKDRSLISVALSLNVSLVLLYLLGLRRSNQRGSCPVR